MECNLQQYRHIDQTPSPSTTKLTKKQLVSILSDSLRALQNESPVSYGVSHGLTSGQASVCVPGPNGYTVTISVDRNCRAKPLLAETEGETKYRQQSRPLSNSPLWRHLTGQHPMHAYFRGDELIYRGGFSHVEVVQEDFFLSFAEVQRFKKNIVNILDFDQLSFALCTDMNPEKLSDESKALIEQYQEIVAKAFPSSFELSKFIEFSGLDPLYLQRYPMGPLEQLMHDEEGNADIAHNLEAWFVAQSSRDYRIWSSFRAWFDMTSERGYEGVFEPTDALIWKCKLSLAKAFNKNAGRGDKEIPLFIGQGDTSEEAYEAAALLTTLMMVKVAQAAKQLSNEDVQNLHRSHVDSLFETLHQLDRSSLQNDERSKEVREERKVQLMIFFRKRFEALSPEQQQIDIEYIQDKYRPRCSFLPSVSLKKTPNAMVTFVLSQ